MTGRDRLRELLDAVLDDDNDDLGAMAGRAYSSPFHFSRVLRRGTGEAPVAMRRRVMLERAAWQLRRGTSVTDAAFAAGYGSVEGFARAYARGFGHPPSATPSRPGDHWLPAPNGIHFHPPTSLWVHTTERPMNPVTETMVGHDLDDTRLLLDEAKGLDDDVYRHEHLPGALVTAWDGGEGSIAVVLEHLVRSREVWLAAIDGADHPVRGGDDVAALVARHEAVAPRWRAVWRDVERRGAWDDVLVDALCDPPESFVMSSVLAHNLTYAAYRRQLVRLMLRASGRTVDEGDPIMWLRGRTEHEEDR
ncbi:helix-turn-helix domain-containing protein [Nocardioides sp. C4-1]|uniref:helix-turn-helix domain-containing protein n=1 Tax=Nocardioides sp. C4-1 TaxID=3151851 RepID=UPI003262EDA9